VFAVDLVCVGDVMLDIRVDAETLHRGGDVHGRVLLQPGGTSSNAAVWAAWSGASTRVHGCVGDDLTGRTLRDGLAARGVEPVLTLDPDASTGTMLVLHEPGERSMVADRGANARLTPEHLPGSIVAGAVLVSGYLLLQDHGHDAALATLNRAEASLVAVETSSWPLVRAFGAARFFDETSEATAVLANEQEARTLTGLDAGDAARELGERYRLVAVKRGDRGAELVIDGECFTAPAEPVVEIDPTGAGDAFDGVVLAALARGVEPAEALARACHAGGLSAASASAWPDEGAA
jgi:sugar/nucleoside kinase (ribokinase family)